ncbi:MAG: alpha/beta hydrolase [Thermomicrobiales bacterium]
MDTAFVLIHSPLVGPLTWSLTAEELRLRGVETIVPALTDDAVADLPFWHQHAAFVAQALTPLLPDQPVTLVGHSGAGPLLPAIGQRISQPVAAYLFVDAGIPAGGASRLDLMADEDPAFALRFRERLVAGGRFPAWTDDDLAAILPDPRLRQLLIADLRPRALAFFTEPIPVFAGWPDAPCGYLKFSAPYDVPARHAREAGWPSREIAAGHFHMLVDPPVVADALIDLAG